MRTVVAVHVPPVTANVPPAVPTLLTAGAALNVKAMFAPAALLTVIVPVLAAVPLAPPAVNAGVGAVNATVAPRTVNPPVRVAVPIGVVTVTFLAVRAAVAVTVQVEVSELDETTTAFVQVTPAPDTATVVAPVRFVPDMVTGVAVPCTPDDGVTPVSVGPSTVKAPMRVADPDPVVRVTFLAVVAAVVVMVKVAVAVCGLRTLRPLTVTPAPLTVMLVAPVRLLPVRVTATAVPRTPEGGATEASVGAGRAMTVKGIALLVPPGAVTVTFLAPAAAVELITKLAFTWVSFCTAMLLTVMPAPAAMAVVPVSPLPKRLTAIVCPRTASTGKIVSSTGPVTA